ncbi:MAG: hypothetical protein ACXVEF_04835 [Polyangiales bacterium]
MAQPKQDDWLSVRELAMRDFSQDASLHDGAATALGTKSQQAGGMPMAPDGPPRGDVEVAVRFGFDAARGVGPSGADWNSTVEEFLRANWEQARRQHADFEQVLPFIRHGYQFGRRWSR